MTSKACGRTNGGVITIEEGHTTETLIISVMVEASNATMVSLYWMVPGCVLSTGHLALYKAPTGQSIDGPRAKVPAVIF